MNNDDDKWPEQAEIPVDEELLIQLPQEERHPSYQTESFTEPGEFEYAVGYDRVVALDRKKYTLAAAKMRFNSICVTTGCRPVQPGYYTARYWCWRVVEASDASSD
jgi:hypothetical protein